MDKADELLTLLLEAEQMAEFYGYKEAWKTRYKKEQFGYMPIPGVVVRDWGAKARSFLAKLAKFREAKK